MKRKILNKRNVVLSSVGFAMISAAGVVAYNVNQPATPVVNVVEEKEPEVTNVEKVEEVKLEEPAVELNTATTPPVAQTPAPAPQPQTPAPVTYKWAAEMATAGIAESDYDIVTQLLLDDSGWVFVGRSAWYKAGECWANYRDLVGCLTIANLHINRTAGTWDKASQNWLTVGMLQDKYQQ